MGDDAKCYAATPAATLEQHITDSNVPKNEAEWWAYHEITRLRAELSDERERADKAEAQFDRLAERHREAMVTCGAEMDSARKLRAELAAVKADCEHGYSLAEVRLAERDALRKENARLREALKDLIEDHEYMTDTDAEEDNLARAHARAAIREGGKDD